MSLVSWRELEFLLGVDRRQLWNLAAKAPRFYAPFDVPKRSGKGLRHIDNPVNLLKDIQGRIYRKVLRHIALPQNMIGGVSGRSVRDNALAHVGQATLVKLDLRNHFGRINNQRVFQALRRELGMSTDIAAVLTQLTTLQHRFPQGAATSSVLANLVLLRAHREITSLAAARGCHYTLFVDDISLSGPGVRNLIQPTIGILHRHGFALAADKLEILPRSQRQETTGIVVNRRITISREHREQIRLDVLKFASLPSMSEHEFNSLLGRIRYLSFIAPDLGESLAAFADVRLPPRVPGYVIRGSDGRRPCRRSHRYPDGYRLCATIGTAQGPSIEFDPLALVESDASLVAPAAGVPQGA